MPQAGMGPGLLGYSLEPKAFWLCEEGCGVQTRSGYLCIADLHGCC